MDERSDEPSFVPLSAKVLEQAIEVVVNEPRDTRLKRLIALRHPPGPLL
jgi:hypothetical protein